jgi:hypothetical protein
MEDFKESCSVFLTALFGFGQQDESVFSGEGHLVYCSGLRQLEGELLCNHCLLFILSEHLAIYSISELKAGGESKKS